MNQINQLANLSQLVASPFSITPKSEFYCPLNHSWLKSLCQINQVENKNKWKSGAWAGCIEVFNIIADVILQAKNIYTYVF